MDNRFEQLFEMVLEIRDKTIQNTTILEEHARRSVASEDRLEVQETKLDSFMEHIKEELEPIKDHVKKVHWGIKVVIGLGLAGTTILGLIEGLRKILG